MKSCLTIIATAALLAGTAANAVSFDFAALAQSEKVTNGNVETVFPFSGWTVDGLNVSVSTDPGSVVWMDGAHGNSPASGLGACDRTDGNCNGAWEDGVRNDETLTLIFDRSVRLTSLFLRESSNAHNAGLEIDHTPYSGAFTINGIGSVANAGLAMVDVVGASFTFRPQGDWTSEKGSAYLSAVTVSPIPLPAAGLLLVGGLAGFGFVRRKSGGPRFSPGDRSVA